jgi:transposase
MRPTYSKKLRVKVAREAADPANAGLEHVIARKYGVAPWTVKRWRDVYLEAGEEGLKKGYTGHKQTEREKELEKENAALREEVAILKKAAAFLANVGRD